MTNKADYIGYVSNVACLHVLVVIVLTTDRPLQGLGIMSPSSYGGAAYGAYGAQNSPIRFML